MIEFRTTDGKSMWVGSTHIVSIVTRKDFKGDDLTEVKLSDNTTWHAVETANALGTRIGDALGLLMGASPDDAERVAARLGRSSANP